MRRRHVCRSSVLLKCPVCLAVLSRVRYSRGQVAVGVRSIDLFRQNSKLKESWPMSKFQPGNQWSRNGNGAGRPAGSPHQAVQAAAWKTLFADWQEGGAAAIKMMRIERPAEYVRVMCSILPKEMLFETGSVSELADDELDQMITMLRERALAVRQEQALELEKAPEPKLLNGRH